MKCSFVVECFIFSNSFPNSFSIFSAYFQRAPYEFALNIGRFNIRLKKNCHGPMFVCRMWSPPIFFINKWVLSLVKISLACLTIRSCSLLLDLENKARNWSWAISLYLFGLVPPSIPEILIMSLRISSVGDLRISRILVKISYTTAGDSGLQNLIHKGFTFTAYTIEILKFNMKYIKCYMDHIIWIN